MLKHPLGQLPPEKYPGGSCLGVGVRGSCPGYSPAG